jgi:hypothetical protein
MGDNDNGYRKLMPASMRHAENPAALREILESVTSILGITLEDNTPPQI